MQDKTPHRLDLIVGARVRAARTSKGISQVELAERLGLTFQQVQKYERGANRISASKLIEISEVLRVAPGEFLQGLSQAPEGAADITLFTLPGAMDLVRAYSHLSPREQKALLQLARSLDDRDEKTQ